ncbi:MAG: DUF3078 domain-containing protein [bacterium]
MKQQLWPVLVCLGACYGAVAAQDAPKAEEKEVFGWKENLVGALNLTQNRFSSNWTKGGENSLAWKGVLAGLAESNRVKTNWKNTGKIAFGQVKQGDQGVRKSDDEIMVESVLTYKLGKPLNPFIAFNGQTQIADGYIYDANDAGTRVSAFFSPAFLRQSLGMGYKPSESFTTRLGMSVKETIVLDDGTITFADPNLAPTTFRRYHGNLGNEKVRVETGLESVTDLKLKLQSNLLFTSKLELFTSFENLGTVDTIWDNTLAAQISKYLTATFNVYTFYDEDILPEVQLRQTMAFGLSYTFLQ